MTARFDGGAFLRPPADGETDHAKWVKGADGQPAMLMTEEGLAVFVGNITAAYGAWHPDIVALADAHPSFRYAQLKGEKRANTTTIKAQVVNLLAYHPDICFTREQLEASATRLLTLAGLRRSNDIIQAANKTDQAGLRRFKHTVGGQSVYQLPRLEFDDQRQSIRSQDIRDTDWLTREERRVREDYKRMAEGAMEIGHMDPRLPLGENGENAVIQPEEVNGAYRDRFIFDASGRARRPLPGELNKQLSNEETDDGVRAYIEAVARAALAKGIDLDEVVALLTEAQPDPT